MSNGSGHGDIEDDKSNYRLYTDSAEMVVQAGSIHGGVHVTSSSPSVTTDLVIAQQRAMDAYEHMGRAQRQLIECTQAKDRLSQAIMALTSLNSHLQGTIRRLTNERDRLQGHSDQQSVKIARLQAEVTQARRMRDRARRELGRARKARAQAIELVRAAHGSSHASLTAGSEQLPDDPVIAHSVATANLTEIGAWLDRISTLLDEQDTKLSRLRKTSAATSEHTASTRPWHRRRKWPMVLALVIVCITATLTSVLSSTVPACGRSATGVSEMDGQCVGVTDGTFIYDPTLTSVERMVATENAMVDQSRRGVTVAFMAPMTANGDSDLTSPEIRHLLEGAFVAQDLVNRSNSRSDKAPLIRLVIANPGRRQEHATAVVKQLAGMMYKAEPLVAVTGLGPSTLKTVEVADALSKYGIPAIGTLATSDLLAYEHMQGFFRIALSNTEQAVALGKKLSTLIHDAPATLFFEDDQGVSSATLAGDMTSELSKIFNPINPIAFPATIDRTTLMSLFQRDTVGMCLSERRLWILYAGHRSALASLLRTLDDICTYAPVSVVALEVDLGTQGRGELDLQNADVDEAHLRDRKITLFRAAYFPPDWSRNPSSSPANFADFYRACIAHGFEQADIDDGLAAESYDGMLTAAAAINLSAAKTSYDVTPTAASVLGQMLRVNGVNSVHGAGGELNFRGRGNGTDRPTDRTIFVQTLGAPM